MSAELQAAGLARQCCAPDLDGRWALGVVCKRTYHVADDGRCYQAEEQLPLRETPEADAEAPLALAHDMDIAINKPACDVVVLGHAYNPGDGGQFSAAVQIGAQGKIVSVIGERQVCVDAQGRLSFSEPVPSERVPLHYAYAYGGVDAAYSDEDSLGPIGAFLGAAEREAAAAYPPWSYPRNPCGRGYLIEAGAHADGMALPQFEDPQHLLTPETLAIGAVDAWLGAPLPQGFGWIDHAWFPRSAWWGVVPPHDAGVELADELRRGWLSREDFEEAYDLERARPRGACGAVPELQFAELRGKETITCHALHPRHQRWQIQLPGEAPSLAVDRRDGRLRKVKPRLSSVIVEPDEDRVSVVWCGSHPAKRRYSEDELATMPFQARW